MRLLSVVRSGASQHRSAQMQSSQSVCGPSVLRRPASLTLKSKQTQDEASRSPRRLKVQRNSRRRFVRLQLGLSVLRRPAQQPRHIKAVGVCAVKAAHRFAHNLEMATRAALHAFWLGLAPGQAVSVHGHSSRCAAIQQSPWPNPSVELTNCSKLQFAAHLER